MCRRCPGKPSLPTNDDWMSTLVGGHHSPTKDLSIFREEYTHRAQDLTCGELISVVEIPSPRAEGDIDLEVSIADNASEATVC